MIDFDCTLSHVTEYWIIEYEISDPHLKGVSKSCTDFSKEMTGNHTKRKSRSKYLQNEKS